MVVNSPRSDTKHHQTLRTLVRPLCEWFWQLLYMFLYSAKRFCIAWILLRDFHAICMLFCGVWKPVLGFSGWHFCMCSEFSGFVEMHPTAHMMFCVLMSDHICDIRYKINQLSTPCFADGNSDHYAVDAIACL